MGGQWVLGAGEEKEMHRGEEEQGAPLRGRSGLEKGKDLLVVRDATADGRVGGAPVPLDHSGEPEEVLGHRQVEHGQKLAGRSGLTAPKKK